MKGTEYTSASDGELVAEDGLSGRVDGGTSRFLWSPVLVLCEFGLRDFGPLF